MTSTQDDIDDSIWQGYVSAVSSLLLSLLLLFALMVLAVATLKTIQKQEVPIAELKDSFAANAVIETPPPLQVVPVPARKAEVLRPTSAQWILRFPEQTVQILPDFHPVMAREMFSEFKPTDRRHKWVLRSPANPDSTQEKRIAYLRLFAARQFLIGEGVAAADIEVRIVEPSSGIKSESSMPVLVSRIKSSLAEGVHQ
jgi:hypothetical protein